jgi:hypothetical protein
MRQRLGNLRAAQTAFECAAHVRIELVVVAHRGERDDGDQAAIARTEVGPPPHVAEHDVVGELRKLRCDSPKVVGDRPGSGGVRIGSGNRRARSAQGSRVDLSRRVHLVVDFERRDRVRPSAVDRQMRQKTRGFARLYAVVERPAQVTG